MTATCSPTPSSGNFFNKFIINTTANSASSSFAQECPAVLYSLPLMSKNTKGLKTLNLCHGRAVSAAIFGPSTSSSS